MSIASAAMQRATVTWLFALVMGLGGIAVFSSMSKLEDPEFTIKTAVVVTPYPGATPLQVEEEVSERLESAIQQLAQVREVRSQSLPGQSRITVDIRKDISSKQLPQVWDELRRKVSDAQISLPPGAGPSRVNDDFGDVYGVLYALTGDGMTLRELEEVARDLRRDLLTIDDVAKVSISGARQEVIAIDIPQSRRVALGLSGDRLAGLLSQHNTVRASGSIVEDGQRLQIVSDGASDSVQALADMLLPSSSGALVRLGDIATVQREFAQPPQHLLSHNGQPAIHIGISTASGGNVVHMGEAVQAYLDTAHASLPVGCTLHVVSLQSAAVQEAIGDFMVNLVAAVSIVIAVLLLIMGWRAGCIIGINLLLTVLGTVLLMHLSGIALQRVSLGALIIAMGMLVDNAIVVVDGVLARRRRGISSAEAAEAVVQQTQWPLLLATVIAILAFSAIGLSRDSTGEFTRSLFLVVGYSLFLSWVLAITLTPLMCVQWLGPSPRMDQAAPGRFSKSVSATIRACVRWRSATVGVAVLCFLLSLGSFSWVKQSFFPASARPQVQLNLWLDAASDIHTSQASLAAIDAFVREQPEVRATHGSVGQGMLRFLLTYDSQQPHPAFAQLIIDVDDINTAQRQLFPRIRQHLRDEHPEVLPHLMRFRLGPGSAGAVGIRFAGPDRDVLRQLADHARTILLAADDAGNVSSDWHERVPIVQPRFNQQRARRVGISREDLAHTLAEGSVGRPIGIHRDGEDLLPILSRLPAEERRGVADIANLHVISASGAAIPIADVLSDIDTGFDDGLIGRVNRQRAITVSADPIQGLASSLRSAVRHEIEAIPLPRGYSAEWVGEYKNSSEAQQALVTPMAVAILAMFLLLIVLFNALRPALVIFACVPLCLIGVVFGLLFTGSSFGFMPLLGLLSLVGMLIKNGIVLVDEIQVQRQEPGTPDATALLQATVSRVSPVLLAAGTTILGMLPLLGDVFFADMAVAIMAGLGVASLLTLLVIPALYSLAYGIRMGKT
ncbi:MAG: efflux RND transporter permease subunit [Planctomycetota bacterium]|nr:MAG: efflux RND transporter permease subunit [Planctomycetota bacterium]